MLLLKVSSSFYLKHFSNITPDILDEITDFCGEFTLTKWFTEDERNTRISALLVRNVNLKQLSKLLSKSNIR
jgi:hypothetical protein